MKKILMTASALALGATAATAGGIERSSQSTAILFEKGNYAELNFGGFSPDVSGVGLNAAMTVEAPILATWRVATAPTALDTKLR